MIKNLFITPDGEDRGRWLAAFPDAVVVGAEKADQAATAELVWIDYDGLHGGQKLAWLKQYINPAKKVVVMSNAPSEEEAYRVIQAGAYGYCHAFAAPTQLAEVATVVAHGGIWVGPQVLRRILKAGVAAANPDSKPTAPEILGLLSKREKMVAIHVSRGASNKEIAEALYITERTVKSHISAMFDKLAVRDRVQLALKLNNVDI
jgi:two-component system nitrate/nitrite response regulator NarL